MHKLLKIQLKKCFGSEWEKKANSPEWQKLLDLIQQSYHEHDTNYRFMEHVVEVNSRELTEAIENIKKSHELLHSVTESVKDLIFYKDLDFSYIGCNQSFARFFGREVEEFIGHNDFELYPLEYASLFREMDTLMLEGMRVRTNEEWVKNSDGEDTLLLTTKAPLINSQGEVFGLVGISRDITEEYNLKQEIKSQQALLIQQSRNAAMGEMIGNIAHQWRQPLNALSLLLQNIMFAHETGRINQEFMNRVNEKGSLLISSMSATIDDFRNFFRPNREKEVFDVALGLDKTLAMLQASLNNALITVTKEAKSGLEVDGFANEFSQVLLNLLNNAKDALTEHPIANKMISIRCYDSGKNIIITINDNAGGISKEIIDRIFDPYFTTKEEGKGTGIGLYMSKMIVENNMSGKLTVHNSEEGALFTITLPRKTGKG